MQREPSNLPDLAAITQAIAAGFQQAVGLATGMERRPPPPSKVYPSTMVNVHNPSKRLRVLYPMATAESFAIEPGQTIGKVRMALHVIEQVRAQGAAELKLDPLSKDQPLVITPCSEGGEVVAGAEAVLA